MFCTGDAIHRVIHEPNATRIAHHDYWFAQTCKNDKLNSQLLGELNLHPHKVFAIAFAKWIIEQQEAGVLQTAGSLHVLCAKLDDGEIHKYRHRHALSPAVV